MADQEQETGVTTAPHTHDHDHEEFEFVEEPKFDIDYKGSCQYEVKVTVPTANEKKKAEEMFDELKGEAELPGFRRGKAPIRLIERKFGKAVKGEVTAKLVSAAFQKLVKDEDLKPIGHPDIEGLDDDKEKEREDGEPLEFTLKFDVAPRVELGKYRGIEVERPVVKVDDKDVDEAIEELREHHASYEPLAKNGKAKEGDQVIIDFKGTVGGEEFSGGSAENYPYILGSKRFFPEFEEALKGAKSGDELTCKVTFPDDYFSEELQGKEADFSITVHEIKRKKKPNVDDDFAKDAGFEGVDDMKAKVREQLQSGSSERSQQIAEARAIQEVVDASTFEISPTMIDAVARQHLEQELRQLIQQGLPREQFESEMEKLQERSRESAERSIKTMTVLNEIGEAEGIEVTDEDLDKEAATISASIGADVQMVADYIRQGEQRGSYMDRIYRDKAMAVIMENAKITDKELTREEVEEEAAALEGEPTDDA